MKLYRLATLLFLAWPLALCSCGTDGCGPPPHGPGGGRTPTFQYAREAGGCHDVFFYKQTPTGARR